MASKSTGRIYVVGSGLMGTDIALALLSAGYAVTLVDLDLGVAQRGREKIEKRLRSLEQQADLEAADMTGSFDSATSIVEAIVESLAAKSSLLREVSGRVKAHVPIFTNTSTLSIGELAASVQHPERFAGMHFFFPAHRNRFLELVQSEHTNPQTMAVAREMGERMKKTMLTCPDRPGFVVNAFYLPFINEAVALIDEGLASPAQVDAVAKSLFGMDHGPLAVTAMMNADTIRSTFQALAARDACPPVAPSVQSAEARTFDLTKETGPLDTVSLEIVRARLSAAIMLPTLRILDEGFTTSQALDRAATSALQFRVSPVAAMASLGQARVGQIVEAFASRWRVPMPHAVAAVEQFTPSKDMA